ncbi:MAG: glycosyltransferase family 2 protein [Actinomycetota bacterium]
MSGGLDIEIHKSREHPYVVFFESLRRVRGERYASWKPGMGTEKRRAILTIVQNEAVFLPIWLRYYSRFFASDDIYVLDHESTDGSTSGGGFVRIPVTHETVDHTWMVRTIEAHQHELLQRYDMVLTTDVDEIVAPNPEWGTLGQYLDRFDEEWINCLGYEVLHLKDREGPFRMDRPILEQRGYWFANSAYDKPALASVPMTWEPGFHMRSDRRLSLDPDLYLIHLHRLDYDICLARHRWRRERSWNQRDLTAGWAVHNLIADEEEFKRWFYEDDNWKSALDEDNGDPKESAGIVLEEIPAVWRGAF